ncbi:MAG: hypothetical protein AB7L66_00105 [Gemmatimonadales bacterium]
MTTPSAASTPDPDWDRAERLLAAQLGEPAPAERRIIAYETRERPRHPAEPAGRRVSAGIHAPGADLVVFFDAGGRPFGWRDDGRLGTASRPAVDPAIVDRAVAELALPGLAVTGVRPVFLDPLGWTIELRCRFPARGGLRSLRAWVGPDTGRVIQVVHAVPVPGGEDQPLALQARMAVLELFRGRLRRAGLRPDPPHRYFVLEGSKAEPFPGGVQVRVRTWRQWSEAWVEFASGGGPPIGWRIDRLAEAQSSHPDAAQVVRLAAQLVPPPADATRPLAVPVESAEPVRAWRVTWEHEVAGRPVMDDFHRVEVDPDRRRLVGMQSRWRDPGPVTQAPTVAAEAAGRLAAEALRSRGFDDTLQPGPPRLVCCRPTEPPQPTDRLAWRVPFADAAGTVDCFVDAGSGAVIGVRSAR